MASERINNERVHVLFESKEDLTTRLQNARVRLEEARTDVFILEDTIYRRFRHEAVTLVVNLRAYKNGMSDREFDLNLLDDEPTPPNAA
jgi:hypothetical protein